MICRNNNYKNYLSDVVTKNNEEINKLNSLALNDAWNVDIIDTSGRRRALKTVLFSDSPTIIDCWATWCGPCLKQMLFEREFEKEYEGRINFIYLSFDRNLKDWKSGSLKLLLKNNYYLPDGFRSDFAAYFKMNAIPRYIVVDRKGNILSPDVLQPSMKVSFARMLRDLTKAK